MEEYGYAIVTPYGFEKSLHNKIVPQLINEGFSTDFKTLISVYDFSDDELNRLVNLSAKRNIPLKLKNRGSVDTVVVVLVKGIDATNKLKKIVTEATQNLNSENDNPELLKVYVSDNGQQAIEDFCEYTGIEDFSQIEKYLTDSFQQNEIGSFNFKELNDVKLK